MPHLPTLHESFNPVLNPSPSSLYPQVLKSFLRSSSDPSMYTSSRSVSPPSYGYSAPYAVSGPMVASSMGSHDMGSAKMMRQVLKANQRFVTKSGQEIEFIEGVRNVPFGLVRPL